ncbi:TPA: hypothetical protein EYP13_03160 [Candidatus Micrarchaeota archaeon]|nr:hypothetical protein [Candidatus Micrarchaeota archaeon]
MDKYARFIAKLAESFYQKAQSKRLLCTAALDEVRMAYVAVAEARRQGVDDYDTVKTIIRSALVKDPECIEPFEEAWRELATEGL